MNEAKILLQRKCWDGAYYLGGYAAECALKACIAKQTERHEFPDRRRTQGSYTHDLVKLVEVAGLEKTLERAEREQAEFAENWRIVRNWSEESRHSRPSQADAEALLNALGDRRYGILPWLKHHW